MQDICRMTWPVQGHRRSSYAKWRPLGRKVSCRCLVVSKSLLARATRLLYIHYSTQSPKSARCEFSTMHRNPRSNRGPAPGPRQPDPASASLFRPSSVSLWPAPISLFSSPFVSGRFCFLRVPGRARLSLSRCSLTTRTGQSTVAAGDQWTVLLFGAFSAAQGRREL